MFGFHLFIVHTKSHWCNMSNASITKKINAINILYDLFKFHSLKMIIFTIFGLITRIVKDILNNCSLEINTIQGLKVKKVHEYSNSIGKFVCRLGG